MICLMLSQGEKPGSCRHNSSHGRPHPPRSRRTSSTCWCRAFHAGHPPREDPRPPAILVDQDVDRHGAAAEVVGLAERLQMPIAVAGQAKAVIDEMFPYYAGIYIGRCQKLGEHRSDDRHIIARPNLPVMCRSALQRGPP